MILIFGIALLYITYYTISFGISIWQEGNRFASIMIMFLALAIIVIPFIQVIT